MQACTRAFDGSEVARVVTEHLRVPVFENLQQQLALGREVLVDRSFDDADARRDLGHRSLLVALLAEHVACGAQDVGDALVARHPCCLRPGDDAAHACPSAAASACGTCSGKSIRICASRSEEHTSELQSLMRISYAVFCL